MKNADEKQQARLIIPLIRLKFWMLIIENFQDIEHDRAYDSCRGFDICSSFIGRTSSFHHLTGSIHSVERIKHQVIDLFCNVFVRYHRASDSALRFIGVSSPSTNSGPEC